MTDKEHINLRKWLLAGSGRVLEAGTKGVLLCLAREQPYRSGIDHILLLCHGLGVVGWQADRLQNRGGGYYFPGFQAWQLCQAFVSARSLLQAEPSEYLESRRREDLLGTWACP